MQASPFGIFGDIYLLLSPFGVFSLSPFGSAVNINFLIITKNQRNTLVKRI